MQAYRNKVVTKVFLFSLIALLMVSLLLTACGPEEENQAVASHGTVTLNPEKSIIKDQASKGAEEGSTNKESQVGIFGNAPYVEGAIIEYYEAPTSVNGNFSFRQFYGLHVKNGELLAMEDIIFADLVGADQLSTGEKEALVKDMYDQMEEANFDRADEQEIIDAHNGYGNESAASFVYYIFDPTLAPLSSYDDYVAFFQSKDYYTENGYKDSMVNNDDDPADMSIEDNSGPYSEETLYGTPKYVEDATIEYYKTSQKQGAYEHNVIMGLHVREGKLLAIESIILVKLINPEDYPDDEKMRMMEEKEETLLELGHNRAHGQEVIEAFYGHDNEEAINFLSYVFDADKSGVANYEAYVSYLIENGLEQFEH